MFDFDAERESFERNPDAMVPAARLAVLTGLPFLLMFVIALITQTAWPLWMGATWALVITMVAGLYLAKYDRKRPATGRHASDD